MRIKNVELTKFRHVISRPVEPTANDHYLISSFSGKDPAMKLSFGFFVRKLKLSDVDAAIDSSAFCRFTFWSSSLILKFTTVLFVVDMERKLLNELSHCWLPVFASWNNSGLPMSRHRIHSKVVSCPFNSMHPWRFDEMKFFPTVAFNASDWYGWLPIWIRYCFQNRQKNATYHAENRLSSGCVDGSM